MKAPWHMRARAWLARKIWGHYDAASYGPQTRGLSGPRGPVDDLSLWSVKDLRARSRHMIRNRWAARRACSVLTTRIIGTGIVPSSQHEEFDGYLALVRDPQRQIGTVQGQTLAGVFRLAFRTMFADGGALVLRQRRTPRQIKERDLVTPWQLEVISVDQLSTDLDDGMRIKGGIETDETGWIVAYHIYRTHPDARHAWDREAVRVPAEDVAYVWSDDEPGQLIAVPWMQAVMIRLDDLDQLSGAQVVRQKIASMWAVFIRKAFGSSAPTRDEIELAPGRVQYLDPGEEVDYGTPPEAGGYMEVSAVTSREVAAGIDISYEDMTGDYSKVNYSSARMGALVSKARDEQIQALFIARLCAVIGRWLIEAAQDFGIDVPTEPVGDTRPALRWTPPRRELLDPGKEVAAIVTAIEKGTTSRGEEIRKQGRDPEDVDRERAADAAREAKLGLIGGPEAVDVQTSALNGAQVTSMVEILVQVASGQIPAESAIRILMRAFQMTKEDAEALVSPAEDFEQTNTEETTEAVQ